MKQGHAPHRPPRVGVLRLDTRFPRPLGDMGQAQTYTRMGLDVQVITVPRASARRVIELADASLLQPFLEAARQLDAAGADLITTSCGFLARYQAELQAAVRAPVLSSALLWCQRLANPGIVTFDARHLGQAECQGAGVPASTPIVGLPEGEMRQVILQDLGQLDTQKAQAEAVQAACTLVSQHPEVQHIVLECTNLPPYRQAIAVATQRTVHDLETLVQAHFGVHPEPPAGQRPDLN